MKIDCINTMFNLSLDFLFDDDGGFFDDEGFVFDDDFTPFDFAYDTLYDKIKLIRHYIILYQSVPSFSKLFQSVIDHS